MLSLLVDGASVYAMTTSNIVVGQLEPKLASSMIKLLHLGNKYVTAVAEIANGQVSVIVRETYRHPNMKTSVSFPISINNGGDFLQFLSDGLNDMYAASEPEVDATTEEREFNRSERKKVLVDSDGNYEDGEDE